MVETGFFGRDLRRGFTLDFGSSIQLPFQQRSDGGVGFGIGGVLKRSTTQIEDKQDIFLRSVKQKTNPSSPPPLRSSPSSVSAPLESQGISNSAIWSFSAGATTVEAQFEKKFDLKKRLLELERQLLDDEEEEEVSASSSVIASSEWSSTMQQLMPPQPPNRHPLSPASTTSTSSSCSSSSRSPSQATPSRHMLLDTAKALSEGNLKMASDYLIFLKQAANSRGSPDQRLTAMMVSALVSRCRRLNSSGNSVLLDDVCSAQHQAAAHMLYEASPCFKLGTVAANLAILEATKDHRKIHILDFNMGHGGNLASLIYAISERHRHQDPPSLKITAVCDPSFLFNPISATGTTNNLKLVGDRLVKLADRLGIGLRFRIVNRGTQELDHATLQCEPGEALAVNLPYILSRVADESVSPSNPRDELLRRVKGLAPKVVTLVEQEMNGNTAPFATRFAEACAHYGALLESFDATVGRESRERARVEYCLAQKAANCVAREGADRVERCEVYGKWRARMSMAGFQPAQLESAVTNSVRIRLDSIRNNPGFTVKLEDTWIGCGWMDRVLTVASAWR